MLYRARPLCLGSVTTQIPRSSSPYTSHTCFLSVPGALPVPTTGSLKTEGCSPGPMHLTPRLSVIFPGTLPFSS